MKKLSIMLTLAGSVALTLFVGSSPAAKGSTSQVVATEVEFHITLSRASVKAGKVTFVIKNKGKLAHQFLILRTKLAANKLPVKGSTVVLSKAGSLIGGVAGAGVKPGTTKTVTISLSAGHYVLLCNIPAHYKAGQFAAFTVK
jgi:uncharacterized cupredoxin-like copper-binding protein